MSDEPTLLLIDSSSRHGRVGLVAGSASLVKLDLDPNRGHARDLARSIRRLLSESSVGIDRISAIALDIGPGSFTGIRVGLTTAKSLCYALGTRMIAVDAFELIARPYAGQVPALRVAIGSQLGTVLSVDFHQNNGWRRAPIQLVPADDVTNWIRDPTVLTGPALTKLKNNYPKIQSIGDAPWEPTMDSLLEAAKERYHARQFDDPLVVEPLYAVASSAEVQWDARKNLSE